VNHYIGRLSTAGGDVGLENSCQIASFRQRAQDAFGFEAARNSVWGCSKENALGVRMYPLPRDTAQTTLIVIIVMMLIIRIMVICDVNIIMPSIMIIAIIIIIAFV
jgi:hypothetical protein